MVIALRTVGLIMHLASTRLIWSISGHLQHLNGTISPTTRLRATLAFAWNPLLLFEAGVNAHSDTTLLFLVLLAVWFLVRNRAHKTQGYRARGNSEERVIRTEGLRAMLLAAAMLALATCLKINIVVLTPGLLFYSWVQGPVRGRIKRVAAVVICWMAVVWLAYCDTGAPWFWPWYMTTFFGLYALLEGSDQEALFDFIPWLAGRSTLFVRLFAFSMFSLCCFFSWGPQRSFVPGLPGFQWSYFGGIWAWALPLLGSILLLRGADPLYRPTISIPPIPTRLD